MIKLLGVRTIGKAALMVLVCLCAPASRAALTINSIGNTLNGGNTLADGSTPNSPSPVYDRFQNDPSFIGSGFNWSGVGRGIDTVGHADVGRWVIMISPSYFVTAYHFRPTITVGSAGPADMFRFYGTNNPSGAYEDHTYTEIGQIGGAGSDLWLGKLTTPVSSDIAIYPILSMPSLNSYANLPILTFGDSSYFPGNDTTVRLGTNNIDPHNQFAHSVSPVADISGNGTGGYSFTYGYNPPSGPSESYLQAGDSGAPDFYLLNGTMPALVGINWFENPPGDPLYSGSTFVPNYLSSLQAMMSESLSIVTDPSTKGDFNLDGHLNTADVQAMLTALTDLSGYKSLHGLSSDYLLEMGDINGDGVITNADIQSLLDLLAAGGGGSVGIQTVPEPASVVLFVLGGLALFAVAWRNSRLSCADLAQCG